MKHMLMDPAFPDIVGARAKEENRGEAAFCHWANDNDQADRDALSDPLLELAARAEIEATRLW